jgi:hypothetical protein
MKYILKPFDRMTCDDWGKELGVKVTQITRHENGETEIHTEEDEKDITVKDTTVKLSAITGMKLQSDTKVE